MLQEVKLAIEELSAAFVRGPEGPELYALLSLAGIGLSLWLLVLLLKRRRSRPVASLVEPSETREDHFSGKGPAQPTQEIVATQAELRELVQGFSALAVKVVRALERDGECNKLAVPQSRVRELLELGLDPTEVALATGLAVGEVALLMNLQKVRLGTGRDATTSSSDGGSASEAVHPSNGKSGLGQITDARS